MIATPCIIRLSSFVSVTKANNLRQVGLTVEEYARNLCVLGQLIGFVLIFDIVGWVLAGLGFAVFGILPVCWRVVRIMLEIRRYLFRAAIVDIFMTCISLGLRLLVSVTFFKTPSCVVSSSIAGLTES